MQVLGVEEMESSSKIDLKDVSWWMSINNACILEALVIDKFQKKSAFFELRKEDYFELHENMIEGGVGPLQLKETYFFKTSLSKIQNLEHIYGATQT